MSDAESMMVADDPAPRVSPHVTMHAIDRASTRLYRIYRRTRISRDEGLASWLVRRIEEAVVHGSRSRHNDALQLRHRGLVFVLSYKKGQINVHTVYADPHASESQR